MREAWGAVEAGAEELDPAELPYSGRRQPRVAGLFGEPAALVQGGRTLLVGPRAAWTSALPNPIRARAPAEIAASPASICASRAAVPFDPRRTEELDAQAHGRCRAARVTRPVTRLPARLPLVKFITRRRPCQLKEEQS